MATTTGRVFAVTWIGTVVCAWIGASPTSAELLYIEMRSGDTAELSDAKRAMANALAKAHAYDYRISATHPDAGAEITSITLPGYDISPIGPAIHDDFYAISGSGIPNNAMVVIETSTSTVTITPELVRPHWVFISALPAAVPVGLATVRLQAPGWTSDAVPIEVRAGPRLRVRTLYSGAPRPAAYAIVFVGNPAIESQAGGTFTADPVLGNRPGYHAAVRDSLRNLLAVTENLLRRNGRDRTLRIVSVFDETRNPAAATSLAHELSGDRMETRRDQLRPFLSGYGVTADLVFVMHGSTTHTRATAWFTTDDAAKAGTGVTYDGANRTHGHFPRIPGSAAIVITWNTNGLTVLHEFGHAASDFNNGMVIDLYVDPTRSGFVVNKKMRAQATDAIPANFATYSGTTYASDQNRDSIGYPAAWRSYHPELIDAARPNLMDNYWLAAQPQQCRLDRLTDDWLDDRLRAKLTR